LKFGTRERGRGNRTKWLSKTAIGSVAASRFPLPDSAIYNNHSFISMNAHVRPEEFCFLEFGTRERGRGNRTEWLALCQPLIPSPLPEHRFPLPDLKSNNYHSFISLNAHDFCQ